MRTMIIALTAFALVACSKSGSSSDESTPAPVSPDAPVVTVPPGPYTPPTTGVGNGAGSGFTYGGTSDFAFDSMTVYNQYVSGLRYVSDPAAISGVKINLNFDRVVTSERVSFGGTVTIRYALYGQLYEGYFTSGHDAASTKYNVIAPFGGASAYHGFFTDFMGAIVVVVDNVAGSTASGSVWFKNFGQTSRPHPATYCWFVLGGAYDCRAWPTADGVNTNAALLPDNGYTRLGTFTNMPINSAFHGI